MVMRSRATDGGVCPNASKKGQIGPSTTVRASRGAGNRRHLASVLRQRRKMRILTPVWESSGESRLMAEKGAFGGTDCGKLITPAGNDLSVPRLPTIRIAYVASGEQPIRKSWVNTCRLIDRSNDWSLG